MKICIRFLLDTLAQLAPAEGKAGETIGRESLPPRSKFDEGESVTAVAIICQVAGRSARRGLVPEYRGLLIVDVRQPRGDNSS